MSENQIKSFHKFIVHARTKLVAKFRMEIAEFDSVLDTSIVFTCNTKCVSRSQMACSIKSRPCAHQTTLQIQFVYFALNLCCWKCKNSTQ